MCKKKAIDLIGNSLMFAISKIVPLTVLSGLFLAIANASAFSMDAELQYLDWNLISADAGEFFKKLYEVGQVGFDLMIPLFCMYFAKGIGGKYALIPAFIGGYLVNSANFLGTSFGAGFIGAILVGIITGFLAKFIDRFNLPKFLLPLMEYLIAPLCLTFFVFLIIYFIIGKPLATMVEFLYASMNYLTRQYEYAPAVYGIILGGMVGFDLGGPINKTASLVSSAIFIDTMNQYGIGGVNAIPQAVTASSISVAPLGLGIASLLFKNLFSQQEKILGNSALLMGFLGISEGGIPFIIKYPKLILANTLSSACVGGFIGFFKIQFFGGIGSPLGAVVGVTSGPHFSSYYWVCIILLGAMLNALMYRQILKQIHDNNQMS